MTTSLIVLVAALVLGVVIAFLTRRVTPSGRTALKLGLVPVAGVLAAFVFC